MRNVTNADEYSKEEGKGHPIDDPEERNDEEFDFFANLTNVIDQEDIDKGIRKKKKKTKKEKKKEKREYLREKRKRNRPEEKKKRKEKKKKDLLKILNALSENEKIHFLNERKKLQQIKKKKKEQFILNSYNEGYKICYNCSFLNLMGEKEISSLAKQVFLSYHYMIKEQVPIQFHFTNFTSNNEFYTQLKDKYSLQKWKVHVHSENYWDIFQREKIVVLSPDAEEELIEVRDDEVYIISALVDRSVSKNLSFHQASLHNLVTKRLPLEKYLKKKKSNVLNVNTVVEILINFLKSKNWMTVFEKCMPQKKVLYFCYGEADGEGNDQEDVKADDKEGDHSNDGGTNAEGLGSDENEKRDVHPDPL
ncbi:tRNA methyltransferase [Plasmodium gonderi]|uniref:tRNA (guanine(9)-N(1))-methyltransferase n=1 Tax=Plasmodium gonderi TaxID=77519 RepID=A0A1Y1JEL3_PLAGO|nr:tRNA methyltransferase [Plasmodium gonderi]GAW80959.1 tRNA methyltransferase [Plasmodium gonderi]